MSGAERTELRERIARAICSKIYESDGISTRCVMAADAVLAVLPGTDAEDAAAIRRVLEDAMRWRANMVNADVTIAATDDDVARLARLGQGRG